MQPPSLPNADKNIILLGQTDRQTDLSEKPPHPRLDSSWYPKLAAHSSKKKKEKDKKKSIEKRGCLLVSLFPNFPSIDGTDLLSERWVSSSKPGRNSTQLCADATMHSTVQKTKDEWTCGILPSV